MLERVAAWLRERGVSVLSDRREGVAAFGALLTVPEAQALLDALGRYADALDEPEDTRTRGQQMADCLLDLVLRPDEEDRPAVQAQLTVVAGVRALLGGDQPGEIGGEPVPAEVVRALARALGLLPESGDACEEGMTRSPPDGHPPTEVTGPAIGRQLPAPTTATPPTPAPPMPGRCTPRLRSGGRPTSGGGRRSRPVPSGVSGAARSTPRRTSCSGGGRRKPPT
ncbi:hypothetical protein [Blastococcus sp. SYSU DS0533]